LIISDSLTKNDKRESNTSDHHRLFWKEPELIPRNREFRIYKIKWWD